jgi:hypothetical protein
VEQRRSDPILPNWQLQLAPRRQRHSQFIGGLGETPSRAAASNARSAFNERGDAGAARGFMRIWIFPFG